MARGAKAAALDAGALEGPWSLPDGWRWERLSSVAFEPERGKPLSRFPSSFRYVDVGGVGEGEPVKVLQSADAPSRARQFLQPNDTLLSCVRVTLKRTIMIGADQADVASTAFCVLRPGPDLDPSFLLHWVTMDFFVSRLLPLQRGGTPPAVLDGDVRSQLVPVPPIEIQKRIVSRINECFAELDDGEAALKRVRDDLETYRKSLLKAAVTGELTADWRAADPSQETGEELQPRILAERRSRWDADPANDGKKYKLGKVGALEDEHKRRMWKVPSSWTWMQLGHFAFVTKLAGFEYTKFVKYDDEGDLEVIKAENAGPNGFKETDFSRVHSGSVSQLTRSRLFGGELLMVFVGAGTGNVGRVPESRRFFLGPNIGMIRLEVDSVDPEYVELFLRSLQGKALAMALSKAVAQPSLSMGTIRQIPIALPPIEEQREILVRLKNELAVSEEASIQERAMSQSSAHLRQSILAAAFRGELVQ